MSDLERPEPQALFDTYKDMVSNIILGGASVVPESNEWYLTSLLYAEAESWYATADQYRRELDPRTACFDNLVVMAARDGIFPLPAQPAQGYVKIEGTAGTVLPTPLTFTADNGQQFSTAVDDLQPNVIEIDGVSVIRVVALVGGPDGNLTTGNAIALDTPIAGVTAVVVCGTFCGGAEAETLTTFRDRYMARLQYQPRATDTWIMNRLADWPCVTRVVNRAVACCAPDDCDTGCGGQLQYYVLFDNTFPNGIAPRSVLDEVQTWLFGSPQGYGLGEAEVGICGRIFDIKAVPINVFVNLVECPSQAQLNSVRALVADYFTTVGPSQNVDTTAIRLSIERVLGVDFQFDVSFEPVTAGAFYGGQYGANTDLACVYFQPCGLEPDCDAMITLGNLVITQGAETF